MENNMKADNLSDQNQKIILNEWKYEDSAVYLYVKKIIEKNKKEGSLLW